MSEGGKDKVSGPQLEDGYTRVANELLEAVFHADFNGAQIRVLLCLIRNTYGYGRKECEFSNSFVANGTGLNKKSVALVINSLQEGNVITVTQQPTYTSPKKVKLNKRIKEWSSLPPQWKTSPTGVDVTSGTGEDVTSGTGEDVTPQKRKILKKDIKKDIKCIVNDHNTLFEDLWKLYPLKKGKGQISDTKKKELSKIGREEMERAIERYKADLKKDEDWRKPQNGSTFFNSGYVDYLDKNYEGGKDNGPPGGRTGTNEKGLAAEAISAGIDTDCTGIFDGY
ncbi:phage replication protein O [Lacrimispora sphenoides]|uniref:replication protein n=1 Tax=Lacrimispora sphenoides TaxID=29370 RepID=UPI0008CF1C6E|nr:replication protein [Lacrimispora sphenoides]SET71690.1 phage replication protein O [Lacrimispora sphenoides]